MAKFIADFSLESHYDQTDNSWKRESTCFLTGLSCGIETDARQWIHDGFRIPQIRLRKVDEDLIADIKANLTKYEAVKMKWWPRLGALRPDQIHGWWQWYFKHAPRFSDYQADYYELTAQEIAAKVEEDNLPIIAGTFLTHKGHMVPVIGYEDDYLVLDDPWGDPNLNYAKGSSGRGVRVRMNHPAFKGKMGCLQVYNKRLYDLIENEDEE